MKWYKKFDRILFIDYSLNNMNYVFDGEVEVKII
jgi:hypothetical protein